MYEAREVVEGPGSTFRPWSIVGPFEPVGVTELARHRVDAPAVSSLTKGLDHGHGLLVADGLAAMKVHVEGSGQAGVPLQQALCHPA